MPDLMSLFTMFGGQNNFMQRLNSFSQQFMSQSPITPEQKVQELLNSRQMSQQQFNMFAQIADAITGNRRF